MNTIPPTPACPFVTPDDQPARAARIPGAVRLADVAPTGIRWLWPGRIPLGRITLLVSDPGLGKKSPHPRPRRPRLPRCLLARP